MPKTAMPIRCLSLLIAGAPLLMGMRLEPPAQAPPAESSPSPAQAPWSIELVPAPADAPKDPHWTLEAYRQDAETLIWEFAKRAHITVTMLDRAPTLVDLYFTNFNTDKAFKAILRAADLDVVHNEDGYFVGLPIDLKLRFPDPEDKVVDATYRCRRIGAASLAETLTKILGDAEFKAWVGPEFLTPAVEKVETGSDSGIRPLTATDKNFRTHDVVFSGPPALVARAMSIARKLDRPRKQVRVNIRVVQMTTNAAKNLGVAWMQSLNLQANEVPNANATTSANNSSLGQQGSGLTVGKFTHSVLSVNATLNAMEQTGASRTVANPTLLVLDGEKSFILSGTKYILPQISTKDSTGQSVYTTTTEKLGLYLQVGVQVGLDDDMVLSIYPQVTSLNGYTTINTVQYPIITTIEEQATVRAVKGDVIVLGGLKKDISGDQKNGVPGLANLPLLGKLFSADSKTGETEELMFFLTPEIVPDKDRPLDIQMSFTEGPGKPAW
jgi:type II secretory pathway component GspD/PulD (secretin)